MRIATWNVERLKHITSIDKIMSEIAKANADILILTETDKRIKPNYKYAFHTQPLTEIDKQLYKSTENRVSIYTNYDCIRERETYDKYTSLCIELETEYGALSVYGTIIGIEGNRRESFKSDLHKQCEDFCRLSDNNLCICGDYNLSFSDNYYFTTEGRNEILQTFDNNGIEILTFDIPECIDHIALSKTFAKGANIEISEWNQNKKLSDHKGIIVDF